MGVQLPTLYTPASSPSPSPVECRIWLIVIHRLAWCYVSARFATVGLQDQAAGARLLGFRARPGQASSGQAIIQGRAAAARLGPVGVVGQCWAGGSARETQTSARLLDFGARPVMPGLASLLLAAGGGSGCRARAGCRDFSSLGCNWGAAGWSRWGTAQFLQEVLPDTSSWPHLEQLLLLRTVVVLNSTSTSFTWAAAGEARIPEGLRLIRGCWAWVSGLVVLPGNQARGGEGRP